MKIKELIFELSKFDPELDVWVKVNNGDDLDYYDECDVAEVAYLDDQWGPIVLEEHEEPVGPKILVLR